MRPIGSIYQIAFTVEDLDAAVRDWVAKGKAGPFYRFDHFTFVDPVYRGVATAPDISIVLGYSGDVFVELIEVHNGLQSVFADCQPGRHLHHVARLTRDFQREAVGAVFTGKFMPSTNMAFLDTRPALGCFTELIEYDAGIEALLTMMADAARNWDGRDAIRSL